MIDRDGILRKIKALKAVVDNGNLGLEETISYAEKVSELMNEYQISEEEVRGHVTEKERIGEDRQELGAISSASWFGKLAKATAILYFSEAALLWKDDPQKPRLTKEGVKFAQVPVYVFFGKKLQREVASSMFEYFFDTAMRLSKNHSSLASKQNDFRKGFAINLSLRIFDLILKRQIPGAGNPENLPMVVEANRKELALYVEQNYSKRRTREVALRASRLDLMKGVEAANGVFLGTQIGSQELEKVLLANKEDKLLANFHKGMRE